MECDLCRHENALRGHSLCASCAEMVRRLIVMKERMERGERNESPLSSGVAAAAA